MKLSRLLICLPLSTFIALGPIDAGLAQRKQAKRADTGDARMDAVRLARMRARMESFVKQGTIPGIVTLVARHGQIVSLAASGTQDFDTRTPMRTDSLFQIASMTKPMTAVGVMILVEEGRLSLNDAVSKHLLRLCSGNICALTALLDTNFGDSIRLIASSQISIVQRKN